MYMHTYLHATTISKKKAMNFKESVRGYMGRFGGRRERRKAIITS